MIRAYFYLGASGVIWMIEGFLFSYYLGFHPWQVAVMAAIYVGLFVIAVRVLLKSLQSPDDVAPGTAAWRAVAVAPMLTVIIGSFASLPLILAVAALGKL